MKEKAIAVFDNKVTWLTLGTFAGTLFGDKVAAIVNAVGSLVMLVI